MALQPQPVAVRAMTIATPLRESASFEERWAAWQAKGAAHDLAVRRKMAIAVPIAMVIIAVIVITLVGR
jgi:hypothetical protein